LAREHSSGPTLKSYIVAFDSGVAPNPYQDRCTLAVCKPDMRRTSEVGDLIIGLTGITLGYQLVYAMYVSEVLGLGEYYADPRFESKKPNFSSPDRHDWMGDNIYERTSEGPYIQHLSYYHLQGRSQEQLDQKKHVDLVNGQNVLISDKYWYFGSDSPQLPAELDFLHGRLRRGHRVFDSQAVSTFEKNASHLLHTTGVLGEPRDLEARAQELEYLHDK
jgi:hypothetical protein